MSPSLPSGVLRRLRAYTDSLPLEDFEGYDGHWDERERSEDTGTVLPRWRIAAWKIPDGSSVLDVGCGSGGFLRFLLGEKPKCKARGTDISYHAVTGFEMIEHIRFWTGKDFRTGLRTSAFGSSRSRGSGV